MSTSESHFRDSEYWDDPANSYFETADSPPERPETALPEYSTTNLPLFGLFLLYVIYWYLQGSYRFEALGAIRFEFLLAALLSGLAIAKIFTSSDNVYPPLLGWAAGFIALMGLMTIFTQAPADSQLMFVDRVLKYLMMGVFIYAFVCSPLALRWFLIAWLFAFAKMAQEGVRGWWFGGLTWENQGTMRLHGSTPNYFHPNSYSGTQLVTLPFLYFLIPHAHRLLQPIMIVQICAAIIVVMTTGSRTGYVALAAGLFLLVWKSTSRIKMILALGLIAILAAPYIPQDYIERAETIFTQQDEAGASIEVRKKIIDDAIEIFEDNKLGVGLSAFSPVRKKRFQRHQDTHNLYLQVLTDLGIQGMILFAALILSCFKQLFKIARQLASDLARLEAFRANPKILAEHMADLKIMQATCFAVIGFLVLRLSLGAFGHDLYEVYWWFAIGLTLALSRMLKVATRRTDWYIQNVDAEDNSVTDEETVAA